MMKKIILASASPRRRELLDQIGIEYEVLVSDCDETCNDNEPDSMVKSIASRKAMVVADRILHRREDMIVIAADTIVEIDNNILGKPSNYTEAYNMIDSIQGREHRVYTGVAMLLIGEGRIVDRKAFHSISHVHLYSMEEDEIKDYISNGESYDKAGGYGIQGIFARYIRGIEGEYSNVVGLPIGYLYRELKGWL